MNHLNLGRSPIKMKCAAVIPETIVQVGGAGPHYLDGVARRGG